MRTGKYSLWTQRPPRGKRAQEEGRRRGEQGGRERVSRERVDSVSLALERQQVQSLMLKSKSFFFLISLFFDRRLSPRLASKVAPFPLSVDATR